MSDKDTGGPAFPVPEYEQHNGLIVGQQEGMTLRDYFAAKAMQEFVGSAMNADKVASFAYMYADAMIKEREE